MRHFTRINLAAGRGLHVEFDDAGAVVAISPSQGGFSAQVFSTAGRRRLGSIKADSAEHVLRQAERQFLAARLRGRQSRSRVPRSSPEADLRWLRSFRGLFNAAGQPINIERHW